MTISARISTAKHAIAEKKNELAQLAAKAAEGEAVDAEVLDTLVKSIEEDEAKVVSLEKAEAVLMHKSAPAFIKNKAANNFSFEQSAIVAVKASMDRTSQVAAAEALYGADAGVTTVVKAATAAADSSTTAWAAELIRPAYGSFLDALRPMSILPQLAAKGGTSLTFDTNGTVIVPFYNGVGQMGGAFIGEGGQIPVKAAAIGQKTVKQAKLGVISVFTRELMNRSTPAIEPIVREAILKDTAAVLDTQAFGASAASAVAPAGLKNGVTAVAAAGVDTASVIEAVKTALNALSNRNMGSRIVMIMRPSVARGLSLLSTTTGVFLFAAEIAQGRFLGCELIISNAAPAGEIIIVDAEQLAFGLGAPSFTVSDSAALQMDNGVTGGASTSLFQTDSLAVRSIAFTAWSDLRGGAVEVVSGLAGL